MHAYAKKMKKHAFLCKKMKNIQSLDVFFESVVVSCNQLTLDQHHVFGTFTNPQQGQQLVCTIEFKKTKKEKNDLK